VKEVKMSSDKIDLILEQWKNIRPDLDCSSMGVVARLRRTSNVWQSKLDRLFKEHGLSSIEFDILATMRRSEPSGITPTELYKTLMLSSGAVSTRLEHLVQEELVERVFSENDRRSCKVSLTSKGIEVIDTTLNSHVKNMESMLNILTSTERNKLESLLRKVLACEEN